MIKTGNRIIIDDDLVLNLDAADKRSYPRSGSTWYDLSKNQLSATIYGTSVFTTEHGGKFDFGDVAQVSQYISLPVTAAQQTGSYYTFEFWMQPVSSDAKYFNSISNGTDHNYNLYQQNTSTLLRYLGSGTISYSNNEILQLCVVRNASSTASVYKNGSYSTTWTNVNIISSAASGGWILNQEQDSLGGGFQNTQNYRGAFMIIRLYKRALTANEIRYNFEANRGRYGI